MYPSGMWIGYWEQTHVGRHAMKEFELHFRGDGTIAGHGHDIVGRFVFTGEWNTVNGQLTMSKQYKGKHAVNYVGKPDGEGSIHGTWTMNVSGYADSGPFGLSPFLPRPTGDEPIHELHK